MSYSIKEKEPKLVCSDQDMSYPYSIKEKELTPGNNSSLPILFTSYVRAGKPKVLSRILGHNSSLPIPFTSYVGAGKPNVLSEF